MTSAICCFLCNNYNIIIICFLYRSAYQDKISIDAKRMKYFEYQKIVTFDDNLKDASVSRPNGSIAGNKKATLSFKSY